MISLVVLLLATTVIEDVSPTMFSLFGVKRAVWQEQAACGPNCLYFLLKTYGVKTNHAELVQSMPHDSRGVSLQQLCDEGLKRGLPLKVIQGKPDNLDYLNLPFIAHVGYGISDHFVVIIEIDKQNIYLIDGTLGDITKYPRASFEQHWSGYLLIIDTSSAIWLDYAISVSAILLFLLSVLMLKQLMSQSIQVARL